MSETLDTNLKIIRGYINRTNPDGKQYIDEYMPFVTVKQAIIDAINEIKRYYITSISEDLASFSEDTFGPKMKDDILEILRKMSTEKAIRIYSEMSAIKSATYGRDIREPLYDALVKLDIPPSVFGQSLKDSMETIIRYNNGINTSTGSLTYANGFDTSGFFQIPKEPQFLLHKCNKQNSLTNEWVYNYAWYYNHYSVDQGDYIKGNYGWVKNFDKDLQPLSTDSSTFGNYRGVYYELVAIPFIFPEGYVYYRYTMQNQIGFSDDNEWDLYSTFYLNPKNLTIDTEWEQGAIDDSTGENNDAEQYQYRARTVGYIDIEPNTGYCLYLQADQNLKCQLRYYNDETFVGAATPTIDSYAHLYRITTNSSANQLRIVLYYQDESTILPPSRFRTFLIKNSDIVLTDA